MKNNLNFVYVERLRHAVIVLDEYGRAVAIKGMENDIALAGGETKEKIIRRLKDPAYQAHTHTEVIGVYKEYGLVHRALIKLLYMIFGGKTTKRKTKV